MSSKFTNATKLQATPKVCKAGPEGWAFVPAPIMWHIRTIILWNGHQDRLPPTDDRTFQYFDRFTMKWNETMNWWRQDVDHGIDSYRLVLTYQGATNPLAAVCGFWAHGNPPLADSWETPPFTPGLPFDHVHNVYFTGDPRDQRLYKFTT